MKEDTSSALDRLSESFVNEKGMPGTGVWLGRENGSGIMWKQTVGEFLSKEENQYEDWLVDGGWGGPPGPVRVHWDNDLKKWISFGFPPWDGKLERWNKIKEQKGETL